MKIVNVRGVKPGTEGIVYCGRKWAGWDASPLGNPCHKGVKCYMCKKVHKTPADTIPCYRFWLVRSLIQENPEVLAAIKSLNEDSVLGCWCSPKPCHCEVIAEVWKRFYNSD